MRTTTARIGVLLAVVVAAVALLVTTCERGAPTGAPGASARMEAGEPANAAPVVARAESEERERRPRQRPERTSAEAEVPTTPLPARLDPVRLRFLVTDGLDRPIEGARVQFHERVGIRPVHVVETNASGRAETTAEKRWGCLVRAAGFTPAEVAHLGEDEIHVVLAPGFPLEGVVLGPDGAPVAEARVTLGGTGSPHVVVTGSDGTFGFDEVPAGDDVHLDVSSSAGMARLVPVSPGTVDARIVVGPREPGSGPPPPVTGESYVVVSVALADGSPLADAELEVYPVNVNSSGRTATTDERGLASIRVGYPPAHWVSVRVSEPEYLEPRRTFNVRAETRESADGVPTRFVVPELTPVRILVLGDSGPLTANDGAKVRFQFADCAWAEPVEAFVVEDAPDAPRHWLNVIAPGYVRHRERVSIVRGRLNELRVQLLRAAGLSGVLAGDSSDTIVDVFSTGEEEPFHHRVSGPDEDGAWSVDHLPPGEVEVLVIRRGVPLVHRRLMVESGDAVDLGDLQIPRPRIVRGMVTGPDGEPLSGCAVSGTVAGGAAEIPTTATSADGRFEVLLGDVPDAMLRIDRRGFGSEHVALDTTGGGRPVAVTLRRGGSVRLVYRRGRSSATSWWVETIDGLGAWQPEQGTFEGDVPDGYGGRVFVDLPAGPLDVVVRHDVLQRRRVEIRPGETIDVRIE